MKRVLKTFLLVTVFMLSFAISKIDAYAVSYPTITLSFDQSDQSVILEGVPNYDASGSVMYEVHGKVEFAGERVESFSYAPSAYPYHIADKQAYVFNWDDSEFLLPGSGEYTFSAWLVALDAKNGFAQLGTGAHTAITYNYEKKDESTNWGPGLPNTTVEAYDLGQIQGKDKAIIVEEEGYTWTIDGKDIVEPPKENISLKITVDPENFNMQGVEEFFGETIAAKFAIDYSGEFGFKAVLDYLVGSEYVGKYANLFYAPGDGTFEFLEGALVEESGQASFVFNHASDYIIAVTDEVYDGQELNPKEDPIVESATETSTEAAKEEVMEAEAEEEQKEETQKEEMQITEPTLEKTESHAETDRTLGIIGSADGPTAIFVANQTGFEWINVLGIIVVVLMLIPNIIYAVKFHGKFNKYSNKFMKILEQVGRYGCMLLMILNLGMPKFGFPSAGNFLVYLLGNGVLLLAYWIVWILHFIKPCKGKRMVLAVIPTCIFLLSGWMLEHWLLMIFAVVFGATHIYLTWENAE